MGIINAIKCDTCGRIEEIPYNGSVKGIMELEERGWFLKPHSVRSDSHTYCCQMCKMDEIEIDPKNVRVVNPILSLNKYHPRHTK